MSLGTIEPALKGNSRRPAASASVPVYAVSDQPAAASTTILTLPSCGSLVYTTAQLLLVSSIVGALWTIASGMWWIKYYVECNQGVVSC